MEKVKINVKGAYGATNFGDDLLMVLFEKYFNEKFSNIDVNFEGMYDVAYPNKFLSNSKYKTLNFREDWLVYGGGTQFFSFKNEDRGFFSLLKKVILEPKRIVNKIKFIINNNSKKEIFVPNHTAFLGFGLGPFYDNKLKIEQVKKQLKNADFIGLRDEVSVNYTKEWGIKSFFGADIAFSSLFSYKFKVKNVDNVKFKKKKIGIVVRDWVWEDSGRAYYEPIMKLYKEKNPNFDFQFIVYAPFKDPEWMEKLEDEDFLYWDPNKYSIEDFLDVLNSFDGFISSRFHGAIVGALLGKPVIAIEIEPKLRILTQDIKEVMLWEKPFSLDKLKNCLNRLDYDVNYSESLELLRKRADFGLDEFIKLFNENR
ncbi:polysaccharide pyruvyl transferase family protein [Polaribacter sp. WD7]|uniref:polysaccharide pyruvyl transferase family protein n=1 Tax=Polaribacter sp. WD7 TaxID=2269061 RepID=UPI000DF33A4C|nr:polysaccharide pyruvyl transferase family protein [Polaribacter sp. WD7]RCS27701.1 polysaccharide pyruvyl transferase family protein [Polaribacter sp. WD7]